MAIVVGPPGEEIHTDIYGRVKVHFPWDRHKVPEAEDSSCWIRVSQPWGGGGYGIMAIPRVGHEVIVEFLEGDPDQPIIMGRTYYAVNMPPYELPVNKTKMVIRSNTHKGQGFNELSFEDNTGAEKIYLHGQKDQEILINNDRSKSIGRDQTASIGRDLAESVGRDMTASIGENLASNIGRNLTSSIGRNLTSSIGGDLTSSIGRDLTESVGNDKNMSVGGDLSKAVSKNMIRRVALADTEEIGTDKNTVVGASHISVTGSDKVESVGSNYNVTAGREINLSAAQEIFSHSRTITLFADQELKFMAPGGMIIIDSKGVTIDAEKIELKSNAIDMNKKNSKASCFKSSSPTIQMGKK